MQPTIVMALRFGDPVAKHNNDNKSKKNLIALRFGDPVLLLGCLCGFMAYVQLWPR